jgi:hypothetical protein
VTPGPPRTSQWPEPSVHQIQDGSTRVCGAEASEATVGIGLLADDPTVAGRSKRSAIRPTAPARPSPRPGAPR